jgi:hypothetical protein
MFQAHKRVGVLDIPRKEVAGFSGGIRDHDILPRIGGHAGGFESALKSGDGGFHES